MKKSKPERALREPTPAEQRDRPEVIVDFVFRQGAFYVAVANIGGAPAHNVAVKFDKPFRGLGGEQEISALALFRKLLFLAPDKSIETFVDTSSAYFARREPTRIAVHITYRDAERRPYERRISHDLSIYKEITFVVQRAGTSSPQGDRPVLAKAVSGIGRQKPWP